MVTVMGILSAFKGTDLMTYLVAMVDQRMQQELTTVFCPPTRLI